MNPSRPPHHVTRAGSKETSFLPELDFVDRRPGCATRYRQLKPGDRFYSTAAAAYNVAPLLDPQQRTDFLYALAKDWPRKPGRAPERQRDFRSIVVLGAHQDGWSLDHLAREWGHPAEEVRRWITEAERVLEEEERLGTEPYIEAVTEPPGLEELARTHCTPKQKELNRKDLEHLMRLPEQVADVLGPLAPLASAVGPPAPEQIAQARGEPPPPPSRRRPPKRSGSPPSFRVRVNERSAG